MMMKRFMLAVSCLSLSACMMADDLHVSGNLSDVLFIVFLPSV